ncbi:DUF6792 domain-containing protein [Rummeliibacillus suwonensis]|uniref:DUF6792 domain-containing protein n=1 Tax=Rummeliibacillus suwonensis TaxID=1306154 RepID=UPI0011B40A2C|nr:DUF6792 domain-containing protein [Rummeliibacillus suwonensis]
MGNKKEVFDSDIIKVRLAKEEYAGISEEQVKQIYLEETGQKLDAKVKVYKSSDYIKSDSGFAGSIIHVYNLEKGINEAYTITRGTEDAKDWEYNVFGLFGGIDQKQYDAAKKFHTKVLKKIEKESSVKNSNLKIDEYGMGHSLGGNLIQTLNITGTKFKKVTAINDAPPNAYQLAMLDKDFQFYLKNKLGIGFNFKNKLIKTDPQKLKKLAEDYYAKKGSNIHHITAKDDMLFWASKIRGFIDLGTRGQTIETNPKFSGLDGTLGSVTNLNDKDLATLQLYMDKFQGEYQTGGLKGFVYAATGIDSLKKAWKNYQKNLKDMISPVDIRASATKKKLTIDFGIGKLPFNVLDIDLSVQLKNPVRSLTKLYTGSLIMADQVIKTVVKTATLVGILSKILKPLLDTPNDRISTRIDAISSKFDTINKQIEHLKKIKDQLAKSGLVGTPNLSLMSDLTSEMTKIVLEFSELMADIGVTLDEVIDIIKEVLSGVSAHGLEELLNGLSGSKKSYKGSDLILTGDIGKTKVKVNISSALRIYKKGLELYDEKSTLLTRMQARYEEEYPDYYNHHVKGLLKEILLMETNPGAYRSLVPYSDIRVTAISVEEKIDPMNHNIANTFTTIFEELATEIETGRKFIAKIRSSIEKIFQKDEMVSQMFKNI